MGRRRVRALRKLRARPGALGGVLRCRAPVLHLFRVRRRLGNTDGLQWLRGKLRILVSGPEPMTLCHFAPLPPPCVSSELARPLPGRTGATRNTGQALCGSPCGRDCRVSASSYAHAGARPSGSRCRVFFFFPAAVHQTCVGSSVGQGSSHWGERLSLSDPRRKT